MKKEKNTSLRAKPVQPPVNREPLSASRKILFGLTLAVIPVIVLLATEAGLRVAGYGGDLDLFTRQTNGSTVDYVLNKEFTKRYFFQKGIETVVPLSQRFSAVKAKDTYRIFCLGESSVQGFPYQPNAAFPAMLQQVLTSIHPGWTIEVVNCGITAISSYSVLDMEEEILEKYRPDLIVVYTGHNEFYGVFGSASRLALFENHAMVTAFLKLQRWKVVLLARNIANALFGSDAGAGTEGQRGTMMGVMAKNAGIRLDDAIVRRTEDAFKQNIEEMVVQAQDHRTAIIVCRLVSNCKDFSPFASLHAESFPASDGERWERLVSQARHACNAGFTKEAIGAYEELLRMDSTDADAQYELARCLVDVQDYDRARTHFLRARDFDVIRFRAPSSFNDIITRVCRDHAVPCVDVDGDFARRSAHGIVGNELLLEHVHPNQAGYLQIAMSVARTMSENGMIEQAWDWSRSRPDSEYEAMSHLTPLDHDIVSAVLDKLTSHWPYTQAQHMAWRSAGDERTEQMARAYVSGTTRGVERLHLEYGALLQREKHFDEALTEYEAALAIQPASEVLNRIGQVYLTRTEIASKDGKNERTARENFLRCDSVFHEGLRRWPNDLELQFNLGLLYVMRADKLNDAAAQFIAVLAIQPTHEHALLFLSEVYVRMQKPEQAIGVLQKAIAYYPRSPRFYTELGALLIRLGRDEGARLYVEKAITLNNDTRAQSLLAVLNARNTHIR